MIMINTYLVSVNLTEKDLPKEIHFHIVPCNITLTLKFHCPHIQSTLLCNLLRKIIVLMYGPLSIGISI
jgi:hypothetical protein